jgi:hypothetical protein
MKLYSYHQVLILAISLYLKLRFQAVSCQLIRMKLLLPNLLEADQQVSMKQLQP